MFLDSLKRKYFFIYFRAEDNNEISDFFSFDWQTEESEEKRLKLKDGKEVHLMVKISNWIIASFNDLLFYF